VITSPTGAVIRDILHRIRDRWPTHVLVWPVVVQGEQAAAQVGAAIRGFNAIAPGGPVPRPELLIVARGGGSIEDLWPFNDEALARTAAASAIPLVSAVGHETDTTLIDFVSDRRAPTPTAAAEIATPVLADLRAAVLEYERRMMRCTHHALETRRSRLAAARLPRDVELLGPASQRFDLAANRLGAGLERNVAKHAQDLARVTGRLSPGLLDRPRTLKAQRLTELGARLDAAAARVGPLAAQRARLPDLARRMAEAARRRLEGEAERLRRLDQLRVSLNPERPLELGFARVLHADGRPIHRAAELKPGDMVSLKFQDAAREAVIGGDRATPKPRGPRPGDASSQGDLF
jgi:exodeoxyribonuclease VII large subunit